MKYLVPKDKKHRKLYSHHDFKLTLLKTLTDSTFVPYNVHISAKYATYKLRTFASFSKIRNRCLFTGRGNSVYRDFRLSRATICKFGGFGYLSGAKNSSW
jgi:small subunit ribosomal protein S14